MKFPNKKYNIIYADPPWQFKYQSKKRTDGTSDDLNIRDPQKEYPCMNIELPHLAHFIVSAFFKST